jgi:hypothetical protein
MKYGPGASLALWKKVLSESDYDLWFGELNKACTESIASQLVGVGVLVGDQGNPAVLSQWISQSGGKFDHH